MRIIHCPYCGHMCKIIDETENQLTTDFNDIFVKNNEQVSCIACNKIFAFNENSIITDYWIANLIFTIKG